jgi:hypothetical protein
MDLIASHDYRSFSGPSEFRLSGESTKLIM